MSTFYLSATLDRKWKKLTTLVDTSIKVANNEFEEDIYMEAEVPNNEFEEEEEKDTSMEVEVANNEFEEEGYDNEYVFVESSFEANENSRIMNENLYSNNIPESLSSSSSSSSSSSVAELPQEFLMKFKESCGENPIILVIQKPLTKTDVSTSHSRISIPDGQIKNLGFLTEEEREMLHAEAERNSRNRRTVAVTLIHKPRINVEGLDDNGMKKTEITLGQWNMHKNMGKDGKLKKPSVMYVLNGKQRTEVAKENMLEQGDEIQIWASRKTIDNKLCMALVVLSKKI